MLERRPGSRVQAANPQFDRFFEDATHRAAVGSAIPDGSIVRFHLTGEGGGTWSLTRRQNRVVLLGRPHPPADCLVRCTAADFDALIRGALDPRQGFMSGRLQVTGDVGIVLGLHRAVRPR
jgi:putative sterol carrier protein